MVNRSLVVALAKEPFREWLQSLPDPTDVSLEEINEDCSAYLIPEYEDDKERDKILKKFCVLIFEDQLEGWWTREEDWPQKRDLRTFKKWFDLRFHSIVEDLVDEVLVDE
ncbi:MAG: hypothetical protein A2075_10230 [Geobacteraceae bacterium GWC2_58_44]|nr:MAG: hypothetical protein A2075_10230 [Geobacteraceae bacterium GWC2_58_44]HBG06683.1 hypothetical protein [Geobacter sp.]